MSTESHSVAAAGRLLRSPTDAAPGLRRARVFLLSDVRLYREGLLYSLIRRDAFEILGAADPSAQTINRVIELDPDAVILDVGSPEGFGIAKILSSSLPKTKIVAFAVSEVEHLVLACAEAGIAGYVPADGSEEDLVTAVELAMRGELYCSPRIAGLLFRRIGTLSAAPAEATQAAALTRRERQILDLLGEGMSNKEIGRALHISDATVKNHVHNILEKLAVHRRGEAAARLRASQSRGPTAWRERQPRLAAEQAAGRRSSA